MNAMFQPWNMSGMKAGQKSWKWKATTTEEYEGWKCHCRSKGLFSKVKEEELITRRRYSFGVPPLYPKIILRQRKYWERGLMLLKNCIFWFSEKLSEQPHQTPRRMAASACWLVLVLLFHQHDRFPFAMWNIQRQCVASFGCDFNLMRKWIMVLLWIWIPVPYMRPSQLFPDFQSWTRTELWAAKQKKILNSKAPT